MNQALITLVTPKEFGRESLDRNGKQAVILIPVAGKMPNRNIISGTVAEREGFELGKTYLASFREVEANEYGRQFQWSKITQVDNPLHIIEATKSLGAAVIYDIDKTTSVREETSEFVEDSELQA